MIKLQDIRPEPIFGVNPPKDTQIWAQERAFEPGKRYLISAISGKGKSTLLHIIYGLRKDYSGTLIWQDENSQSFGLNRWSDLRQKDLSIVFQDLRLFPNLSTMDNLRLKNQLHHFKSEAEIITMAERLGIAALLEKPCGQLSYGQRQRAAIIRALCQPFHFLLLDEPFSHLDQENINIACQLIDEEVKKQEAGIILVSLGEIYPLHFDEQLLL